MSILETIEWYDQGYLSSSQQDFCGIEDRDFPLILKVATSEALYFFSSTDGKKYFKITFGASVGQVLSLEKSIPADAIKNTSDKFFFETRGLLDQYCPEFENLARYTLGCILLDKFLEKKEFLVGKKESIISHEEEGNLEEVIKGIEEQDKSIALVRSFFVLRVSVDELIQKLGLYFEESEQS